MTDQTNDMTVPGSAIQEAALSWVLRLSRSTVGERDWIEFNAWLDAAETHRQAYDQAINLWSDYQAVASAPKVSRPARTWRRALGPGIAVAASVLVVLAATDAFAPTQVLTTQKGETRSFRLQDGTRIDLNASSSLKVKLGWRTRQVAMSDAEAVFDVAKDSRRPFVITAGDEKIRVVGTRFNVRRRDGVQSVTVERGRVEVASADHKTKVALIPGQRLDHHEGMGPAQVRAFDPEVAMSWRSGRLIYRNEPLSNVAADLTRLSGPSVRLADARTGDLTFSGVISAKDSQSGARVLGLLAPITVQETPSGLLLRRN